MQKKEILSGILKTSGKLAIALSGGLDSSVLLAFASAELGKDNVLALVVKSPYMMSNEIDYALGLCKKYSIRCIVVEKGIAPEIEYNPKNRCYLCKQALFSQLKAVAAENGFDILTDGTNFDDLADYRPGMKALAELGVKSPLLDAKFTKGDIRALANTLGLVELKDKAAYACLMTRFEIGTKITREDLILVDNAENFLHSLGFQVFRVRKHGACARLELGELEFAKLLDSKYRENISNTLKKLGFKYVAIDLSGYSMGSMNK